ncbi:ornithine carbamoyltransferase [Stackebrandtia soli]|uniref:ornithine carbamoyltransferase n=1 Tax=Stackebrandtia soli TaxID=1892856 RepID=UPI0039E8AA2C
MKHFLKDDDITADEQRRLIAFARELKTDRYTRPLLGGPPPAVPDGIDSRLLATPRSVAVIFEKESTRTRMSFQVGITELGGNAVLFDAQSSHLARGESIEDTARVLSRYVDAIVIRTFADARIAALAGASSVPVVNALTDGYHPCQLLADLMTITEEFGAVAGRTIAFVGDTGNNMGHSYLLAGALAGAHVRLAGPDLHPPAGDVLRSATELAAAHGGSVSVTTDPIAAIDGADVVATDTWLSMGQDNRESRMAALAPYRLDERLLANAAEHAIVLHCLPAHRGEEITDEVMDGPQSRVFEQAENRLHTQKALLAWLITDALPPLEEVPT